MDLTQLRTTYDALDQQHKQIGLALMTLRPLLGMTGPTVAAVPSGAPPADQPSRPELPAARDKAPTSRRVRSAPVLTDAPASVDASDDAILAVVKRHGSVSPKTVIDELGIMANRGRYRIGLLVKEGRLVASGSTTRRLLSLAGQAAPPAAARAETPAAPVAGASLDKVLLEQLKRRPLTLEELVAHGPTGVDEEAKRLAVRRALRRLTIDGKVFDLGTKFKAA